MASEVRVNQIQNRSGLGTITVADSGVVISGITTISDLRTSGTTVVAAGTTSAPSISPSGDSNTGIFFPSADTVCIGEGGTEVIRVNSSGNVGIGTTNISAKLTLSGGGSNALDLRDGGDIKLFNAGNSGSIHIYCDDDTTLTVGGALVVTQQPGFVAFSTANQDPTSATKIRYQDTTYNRGYPSVHYSTTNSRFTAPVTGLYTFNVRTWFAPSLTGTIYVLLYVNNSIYAETRMSKPTATAEYSTHMPVWNVSLAKNDYVEIFGTSTTAGAYHTSSSIRYSEFSGYLVC